MKKLLAYILYPAYWIVLFVLLAMLAPMIKLDIFLTKHGFKTWGWW